MQLWTSSSSPWLQICNSQIPSPNSALQTTSHKEKLEQTSKSFAFMVSSLCQEWCSSSSLRLTSWSPACTFYGYQPNASKSDPGHLHKQSCSFGCLSDALGCSPLSIYIHTIEHFSIKSLFAYWCQMCQFVWYDVLILTKQYENSTHFWKTREWGRRSW